MKTMSDVYKGLDLLPCYFKMCSIEKYTLNTKHINITILHIKNDILIKCIFPDGDKFTAIVSSYDQYNFEIRHIKQMVLNKVKES